MSNFNRESINTSYYRNKKSLINKLPDDILRKIISESEYEDNYNINLLDRDLNSRFPKNYLESISHYDYSHGTVRTYYDEEKTLLDTVEIFRNGIRNGIYLKYYFTPDNRQTYLKLKYNFKNDKLEGKNYEYEKNGNIAYKMNHKNGKLHGRSIVYNDEKIEQINDYKNGDALISKQYNKDGKLFKVLNYENNKLIKSTEYEDGKLSKISNIKNGVLHGLVSYYNLKGKLMESETYENGRLQD
jgi:antitoxin component YwqK of YwqJK toxin-antitoxin module